MKLKECREKLGLSVEAAAAEIGVSDVGYRYWESGQKIPSRENMKMIFDWSGGLVTPNDFYSLPDGVSCATSSDPVPMAAEAAA